MPRKHSRHTRQLDIGARAWHIFNRGANGQTLFRCDEDRDWFVGLLAKYLCGPYGQTIELLAACPLSTHFHLVLIADSDEHLSRFMQRLMSSYAIYYRKTYGGRGPVFDGPFRRKAITDSQQLRWTIAYVHDNHPEGLEYRYSTHRDYESREAPVWLAAARGLDYFGGFTRYREFMEKKARRAAIDREFFAGGRRRE